MPTQLINPNCIHKTNVVFNICIVHELYLLHSKTSIKNIQKRTPSQSTPAPPADVSVNK